MTAGVMKTYHLRPPSTAAISWCGANAEPEKTLNSFSDFPIGSRVCLRCMRRLKRIPLGKKVPQHLAIPPLKKCN